MIDLELFNSLEGGDLLKHQKYLAYWRQNFIPVASKLILTLVLLLIVCTIQLSAQFDIKASITVQWGNGCPPIIIFGKNVQVGEIAIGTLEEENVKRGLAGFEDPLPVYSMCRGHGVYRDANFSVISRITLGQRRVLVLIRHAGGRGSHPGSEGFVQVGNGWEIAQILTDGVTREYGECFVNFDRHSQKIIWRSRAACPACGCLEGRAYISFVAEKF